VKNIYKNLYSKTKQSELSYKLRIKIMASIVNGLNFKGKNILNIGCNDGYIGKNSDKSNIFYGLDFASESIEKAKKNYKNVILYDLNNLENLIIQR